MIIKKWNASLEGTDKWEAQAVETTAQSIKTTMGGTAIFDSNNKILPNHLPDSVFDSLFFADVVSSDTNTNQLLANAIALGGARSRTGMYFVAGGNVIITSSGTGVISTVNYNTTIVIGDVDPTEGVTTIPSTTTLESGDWILITNFSGAGTVGSPYLADFQVINNTYEIMVGANGTVAGAPGLVPVPASTDNTKFLKGDGTWATPTDNNTATAVDNILDGSNSGTAITYAPYTTNLATTGNRLYTTTDVPTATTRLNLSSYLWATRLHSLGIYGGDTSGGNLTIGSTSNATKGLINFDSNTRFTSGTNRVIDITAASGTNIAGNTLTVASGAGTGTGTVSTISFQTPTVGTTGTTAQTLVNRLVLNSTGATVTGAVSASTTLSSGTTLTVGTTTSLGGNATFTNAADRTLSIADTASGTPGRALNILSGSTVLGGTNIAGGNVNVRSGVSTGTATSSIVFQTPTPGVSGTAANALADRMTINNSGVTVNNNLTVTGDIAVNGGDITSTSESFNFINQNIASQASPTARAINISTGSVGNNIIKTLSISTGSLGTGAESNVNIGVQGNSKIALIGQTTAWGDIRFEHGGTRALISNNAPNGSIGNTIQITAGSTTAGTANIAGGSVEITSGRTTGSATSLIKFSTPNAGTAGATSLNDLAERMSIASTGVTIANNLTVSGQLSAKIGTSSGVPIITTTGGVLSAGSFGTTSGTFAEGDDSRLSDARTPLSHSHGDITNAGTITSTVVAPANGDHIIISDANAATANTLKRSIAIGTSTTTFLNNAGDWATPVGAQYTAGEGLTLTGTEFKQTYPVYHGDTLPTSGISSNAIGFEW